MNTKGFLRLASLLGILTCALIYCQVSQAQMASGSFAGIVTDPTGAIIPGAEVAVTNESTDVTAERHTNSSGVYRADNLLPGLYTIRVEAKGFRAVVDRDLDLTVGVVQRVDFQMKLGTTVQTITVVSKAPLVNSEEGRLSSLVSAVQVSNLPLNGRDVYQLMKLAPGAVNVAGVMFENQTHASANTVINGVRENFSGFWIDGVANKGLSGGPVTQVNQDIVQEFRINTLNLSAEYGNSAGAVTTIVTKSGTNHFHGTAYDFLRNDALDATEFFRNKAGCELGVDPYCHGPARPDGRGNLGKATLRFNQFGGTLGGPIRRDKTFFFASFQGDRTRTFAPAVPITLESPEWRQAVINALPNSVSALVYKTLPGPSGTVLNTVNQFVADNYGGFDALVCPDYFVGTRIASNFQRLFGVTSAEAAGCPSAIPVGQTTEQLHNRALPFQESNVALLPTQAAANGVLFQGNEWSARIDQNLREGDRIFGRFYYEGQTDSYGSPGSPSLDSLRGTREPFGGAYPNLAVSWIHIISPTVVNELRAGYTRNASSQGVAVAPGIPDLEFFSADTGFGSYNGYPQYFHENIYNYSDLVSVSRGKHGLKMGVQFQRNIENSDFNDARPVYGFFDNLLFAADAPAIQIAGVDPGIISKRPARLADNVRSWRNLQMGLFIQDDWKVSPHLTLNLGLRYDLYTRHTEKYGKVTQFIFGDGANITEQVRNTNTPAGLPGCDTAEQVGLAQLAGVCGPGGFAAAKVLGPGDHNNFGPRLGFAWSPGESGKTAVRGGFGVSYEGTLYNPLSNTRWNLPFYSVNLAYNFLFGGVNNVVYGPSKVDANGNIVFDPTQTPTFTGPPTNPGQGVGAQAVGNLSGWDPNNPNLAGNTAILDPSGLRDPYVYSFFFGVQRELAPNLLLEVNYVGTAGHKLFRAQEVNRTRGGLLPIPGTCADIQNQTVCSNRDETISPVTGNFINPAGLVNPNYQNLRVWENSVNSIYNSLQVSLTRKPTHGLSFAAHYTWGHSIDEGSDWHQRSTSSNGPAAGDGYSLDVALPQLDRGDSTFDFRHRLVVTQVWELPWRRNQRGFVGHLLGGWQLNSIWSFQTGSHWTAFDGRPRQLVCQGGASDGNSANSGPGASGCLAGGGEIVNVGGDFNLDGAANDRPDPVGPNTIHATKDQWANGFFAGQNAYDGGFVKAPCLGCNGALGRNTLVGPDLFDTDFSAFKRFRLGESVSLQFRCEVFNTFNRANFQAPSAGYGGNRVNSPNFGAAAGTFDPREIQMALKLLW